MLRTARSLLLLQRTRQGVAVGAASSIQRCCSIASSSSSSSSLRKRVAASSSSIRRISCRSSCLSSSSSAATSSSTPLNVALSSPSSAAAVAPVSYTSTMLLGHTVFPSYVTRIDDRERELQSICVDNVYRWQLQATALPGQRELRESAAASASSTSSSSFSSSHPSFLLHDGPPFANGALHMGHFLNKTLKDFINRYKLLRGYRVEFIPGWDCHGMPIEVKALEAMKLQSKSDDSNVASLSPTDIRTLCRSFALAAQSAQLASFTSWGLLGSWAAAYRTMDPAYESRQLRVFADLVAQKLVHRGLKPVHWSPASRTALAEAELEYVEDHVSPSLYALFPIVSFGAKARASGIVPENGANQVKMIVWTTTPWSLPSNMAVCYRDEFQYCIVKIGPKRQVKEVENVKDNDVTAVTTDTTTVVASTSKSKSSSKPSKPSKSLGSKSQSADAIEEGLELEGTLVLIGLDRLDAVIGVHLGREYEVLHTLPGANLEGSLARHPFIPERLSPLIPGAHVTSESGSALVHTAPAHGMDDFIVCKSILSNTEMVCPIDDSGDYTSDVGHASLVGQNVLRGANKSVISLLRSSGNLLYVSKLVHRYPYDWRTRTPVILRATAQWFCALDALQPLALRALELVKMTPPSGKQRLASMVASRTEWCISRQRHWGVPIPVFYDSATGEPLLTKESVEHVASVVETHGTDAWWKLSTEELLAPEYRADGRSYVKGTDTMDVWFDSGCSWSAVLHGSRASGMIGLEEGAQADLYLEGSDQHRGWFQSSLLTSVAVQGKAPYKEIFTHGFVLDDQYRKMSKSLGNVIDPKTLIHGTAIDSAIAPATASAPSSSTPKSKKTFVVKSAPASTPLGVDLLRLWVASTDSSSDVSVGRAILSKTSDAMKKLRLSIKFMLGCVDDFDADMIVPYQHLSMADKYMLHLLHEYVATCTSAYDRYDFQCVYSSMHHFASVHLSSFYIDLTRDRLYSDPADSRRRRSAQSVMMHALVSMTKTMAPIMPHLAEEVYQSTPNRLKIMFKHDEEADIASSSSSSSSPPFIDSVFMHGWPHCPSSWHSPSLSSSFVSARRLRSYVHSLLEPLRAPPHRILSSFAEASVTVEIDATSTLYQQMIAIDSDLTGACSVGRVTIVPMTDSDMKQIEREEKAASSPSSPSSSSSSSSDAPTAAAPLTTLIVTDVSPEGESTLIRIRFAMMNGRKCPRCWTIDDAVSDAQVCCARCTQVMSRRETS